MVRSPLSGVRDLAGPFAPISAVGSWPTTDVFSRRPAGRWRPSAGLLSSHPIAACGRMNRPGAFLRPGFYRASGMGEKPIHDIVCSYLFKSRCPSGGSLRTKTRRTAKRVRYRLCLACGEKYKEAGRAV